MLLATIHATLAFTAPLIHPQTPSVLRTEMTAATKVRMELSEYEQYAQKRGGAEMDAVDAAYRQFKGIDQEFDGGDSGGGVVGDGNTDLEDQHNNPTLGALRGGIADVTSSTMQVGRGNVLTADGVDYAALNDQDEFGDHSNSQQATNARTSSAGANYFGRSTGLADKLIDGITEEDLRSGKMDCVRAQQKENWFNQRAIHAQNRAQGQGVVFGEEQGLRPSSGGYIARESLSSKAWREGAKESEISTGDLANHLADLASKQAPRLDGEPWAPLAVGSEQTTETFEVRASPRQTTVTEINVKNDVNTFAPFQCGLIAGSSECFSLSPQHGTMNRRSGEPINLVVRYTPTQTGVIDEAVVVFETEDFKRVYHFIGGQ